MASIRPRRRLSKAQRRQRRRRQTRKTRAVRRQLRRLHDQLPRPARALFDAPVAVGGLDFCNPRS